MGSGEGCPGSIAAAAGVWVVIWGDCPVVRGRSRADGAILFCTFQRFEIQVK